MVYLDNAATTYPKPPEVTEAVMRCMRDFGGNPGRGSHRMAMLAAECVYTCREAAADLFGMTDPSRVVFTMNTTYALNMAIKCTVKPGDHVLIGNMEHNAVRRPVEKLAREDVITYDVFEAYGDTTSVMHSLKKRIRSNTRTIICAHTSNICNKTAPVREIGAFCRAHGICFIVDGAQSAGIHPVDLRRLPVDMYCVPGHKGLYGPQGCGMMLFGSDRYVTDATLVEGGSGSHSLESAMPRDLPEHFEAGTLPTPSIAGLTAGIRWVERVGVCEIRRHECFLFRKLYENLRNMDGVRLYDETPGAVLLFRVKDRLPAEIASHLDREGICVRAGLHCAPMAHKVLETGEDGAIRVSFSAMNTEADVRLLTDALYHIIR